MPEAGASQRTLPFSVVVNGQLASTSSDAHPAQIHPAKPVEVRISIPGSQSSTLRIATVRIEGDVLDLPLFSYDTAVDLVVPPHHSKSLSFPVNMNGVGSQATGLVVATVTLLSPRGTVVGAQSVVTNVHGSISSLYGLFALAVLALTVSSLFFALLAMARHQLSRNRWMRAVRFVIPGFGVGLVLIFTTSVLGVFAPGPGHWLPLLIIASAVGLAGGYLTPAPNEEEDDDYDPNVIMAEIMVVDEDPLAAQADYERVRATTVVRPTADPGLRASGVPDGRATGIPDGRATGVVDSRATGGPVGPRIPDPDGRATSVPESRPPDGGPTADPDGRATTPP